MTPTRLPVTIDQFLLLEHGTAVVAFKFGTDDPGTGYTLLHAYPNLNRADELVTVDAYLRDANTDRPVVLSWPEYQFDLLLLDTPVSALVTSTRTLGRTVTEPLLPPLTRFVEWLNAKLSRKKP